MKVSYLVFATTLALTACGNLSEIKADGTSDNLRWPVIDQSGYNRVGHQYGSWPNWDNLRMIERGMNKSQILDLIGRPHFDEGFFAVREWDYAFNYRENDVHKICQYKILFDKDMNAQSFFWYPNGCNGNAAFSLSGDFMFDFKRDGLTEKGNEVVESVAQQLKTMNAKEVKISGHTDNLGVREYNLELGLRRAERVKARLIELGVNAEFIVNSFADDYPVVECKNLQGKALESCLRPNRRVEISASGEIKKTHEDSRRTHGTGGPGIYYQK